MDQDTYLWSHSPILSAFPSIEHCRVLNVDDDAIDEAGVFELENGKFVYISFIGLASDLELGYTLVEEFDNIESAKNVFELYNRRIDDDA